MATAIPKIKPKQKTDPTKQYVSGGSLYGVGLRSIPTNKDELTWKVGADVFDRMANDPEVSAAVWLLVMSVLADGVQISTAVADEKDKDFAKAAEIQAFCARNLTSHLQRPFRQTLEMLLIDAIKHGHKVAEQTYELARGGEDKGKLVLSSLKVKPRKSVNFVIDEFWNVMGFTYRKPSGATGTGANISPEDVLPREKFAVLTLRMQDEDPRGESMLRPAYNAWNLKLLNYPSYLKYLLRWAEPSLVGECAENQERETGEDGESLTPTQVLKGQLVEFQNGSVIALPAGGKVYGIEAKGSGDVFTKAFSFFNKEIRKAILQNELSNADAEHQTKGSTESQQDTIVEGQIWYLKNILAEMIQCDIIKPMITYNFGEDNLAFMPTVSLGDSSRKDWSSDGETADKLLSNDEVYPSQKQWLTTVIGMPAPTKEEVQERAANKLKMQEQFKNGNKDESGQSNPQDRQGTRPTEQNRPPGDRQKP